MPPLDLVDLVFSHAAQAVFRKAVEDPTRSLTYQAFREEILRAAGGLWQLGARPRDRVGLRLSNSVDFVVAAFASLYIGATFVPLAPDDPAQRLRGIVAETDPTVIITKPSLAGLSRADELFSGQIVLSLAEVQAHADVDSPPQDKDPRRPAYCVYTSGTTGKPKGVLIRQDSLLSAAQNGAAHYGLDRDSRAICLLPFHFDGSFDTIFPVLCAGGSLVIPPRETVVVPRMYIQTLQKEQVTHAGISPSFLRLLLASPNLGELASSRLTTMWLGGEVCSAPDLQRLLNVYPDLKIFNRYGPTETTIAVSTYQIDPGELNREFQVPIEKPDKDVVFALIDGSGALVDDVDTVGELCIGGVQLMEGYWNDQVLTDAVVRSDVIEGTRVYRTGDLVVRRQSGDYVYVDRNDNIVKRNGIRISLEEVALALMQVEAVTSAVCVASPRHDNVVELAAFVVLGIPATETELRHALRTRLPASMLPNVIRIVEEFPLTASGKVDGVALRKVVWPASSPV